MSRFERVRTRLKAHPVTVVFALLVAAPATLTVFSFRQPIPLPDTVLSEFELLFWLLVYAPVAAIRTVLFDPLGLGVLFSIPGLGQTLVFFTVLGFYYGLSLALVNGTRLLSRRRDTER